MADSSADRSLPPTPRRREAARRAGMIPGPDQPAWGASCLVVACLLPRWLAATADAGAEFVRAAVPAALEGAAPGEQLAAAWAVASPTVAVVLAAAAAGIAVPIAWDGLRWEPGRVAFTVGRLAVGPRLARIVSADTLRRALGAAAGLAVVGAVAASAGGSVVAQMSGAGMEPRGMLDASWRMLVAVAVAAVAVALAGFLLARRRSERRLWMTPEEYAAERRALESGQRVRFPAARRDGQSGGGR